MKKAIAIALVIIIALGWIFALTDTGPSLKDKIKLGLDLKGGVYVVMEAQTDATGAELATLMEQTQVIIEDRVNQMGLSEPTVTIEGEKKIRVELPGAENADEAIKTIGKTAQLQFVLGDGTVVVDGSHVKDAGVGRDEKGFNAVDLEFDSEGAVAFEEATRRALYGEVINPETGQPDRAIYIVLDDNVISSPLVNSVISGGRAQITGQFSDDEVTELAMLIRGGALPVGLKEVQTSVVGPSLGIDSLNMSLIAGVIGVGLILIMMIIFYKIMGLIADIALLLYILLVFWVLALFSAVLNLPGIAGLILSVGMAVDSNVIIFARIKEEYMVSEKSLRVSVDSGFHRALKTIIDSQFTTMLAGIILYQLGSGPVKGFALTLMIGIVISVLTAVIITQFLMRTLVETKSLAKPKLFGLEKPRSQFNKEFSFIKRRKIFYLSAVVLIVIGLGAGLIRGFNWGIDFTGGTMMQFEMERRVEVADVERVLDKHEVDGTIVHAGENNTQIIIRTTQSLENEERNALFEDMYGTFNIAEDNLLAVEQFSASVGDLIKKNAVKALLIATAGMLIYIIIRFEWKFAIAAIVALVHDVLIMIAFYGLFNIPINSPFIAAILTIIGYSINDTIVIFDRIRENFKIMKKNKMEELIDKSINQTIVRSLMTSATTIVAIIPLLILGGETIREFLVPMMVGLVAGTISSIAISSPVYYEIYRIVNKPKYKGK
ncbi:MAG TPA: protein translocase subunit SecD [Bacillota bacterium]|jgi:SecD/SecF fusion protein|nr:protein translocase subunit SecD [Bacillota bacterium]HPZ59018.1 protein translocase subunit SecD [Bacillota bacterium]HQC82392.1 protein translocase subunit SecD [Bacillota bacterium]